MKILYILKQKDPDATVSSMIAEHRKEHEVTIVSIRDNSAYDEIVDLIAANDRVISW